MNYVLTCIICATMVQTCLAADMNQVTVVDTQSMPWQHGGLRLSKNWALKIVEDDPKTGRRVAIAYLPAGLVTHEGRHYHQFRQWFYFLHGDIPVFDYTSPQQKKARVNILREGYFVERPVASMHGDGGPGDPVSQEGSMFVMWLENSLPSKQVPFDGPYPTGVDYKDDTIIDTRAMSWSQESGGSMSKRLSPTVRLVLFPPGWKGAKSASALTSSLVLYGSASLESTGTSLAIHEGSYIRQPGGEVVQLQSGDVGCEMLEWSEAPGSGQAVASQ